MARRTLLVFCASLAILSEGMPATATDEQADQIVVTVSDGYGNALRNAEVAVYLHPFNPPQTYSPPIIASGRTDLRGNFGFSLETDYRSLFPTPSPGIDFDVGEVREINVKITTVSADQRYLGTLFTVLPLFEPHSELVVADVDLYDVDPLAGEREAGAYTGPSIVTCDPSIDPDGGDPSDFEVVDDPESPADPAEEIDPLEIACSLPMNGGFNTSAQAQTNTECYANLPCALKSTRRWAKVLQWHIAKGMRSTFSYQKGSRETRAGVAFKVGGGAWSAGGMWKEARDRNVTAGLTKTRGDGGGYHRVRFARYLYIKWKEIKDPGNGPGNDMERVLVGS